MGKKLYTYFLHYYVYIILLLQLQDATAYSSTFYTQLIPHKKCCFTFHICVNNNTENPIMLITNNKLMLFTVNKEERFIFSKASSRFFKKCLIFLQISSNVLCNFLFSTTVFQTINILDINTSVKYIQLINIEFLSLRVIDYTINHQSMRLTISFYTVLIEINQLYESYQKKKSKNSLFTLI